MLYDGRHVFINGEAVAVRGAGAALLRRLADDRRLDARAVRSANRGVQALLAEWLAAGWLALEAAASSKAAR
jgi:50S ribosomal protein L16 3-hydroxylase